MKRTVHNCGECKYFNRLITTMGWGKCTLHNTIVKEYFPACDDFKEVGKDENNGK